MQTPLLLFVIRAQGGRTALSGLKLAYHKAVEVRESNPWPQMPAAHQKELVAGGLASAFSSFLPLTIAESAMVEIGDSPGIVWGW